MNLHLHVLGPTSYATTSDLLHHTRPECSDSPMPCLLNRSSASCLWASCLGLGAPSTVSCFLGVRDCKIFTATTTASKNTNNSRAIDSNPCSRKPASGLGPTAGKIGGPSNRCVVLALSPPGLGSGFTCTSLWSADFTAKSRSLSSKTLCWWCCRSTIPVKAMSQTK